MKNKQVLLKAYYKNYRWRLVHQNRYHLVHSILVAPCPGGA